MPDWIARLLGISEEIQKETEGTLVLEWLNKPPGWLVFFIIVGVCILAYLIYRLERRDVTRIVKLFLSAIRALVVVIVLFMLFGPILSLETKEKGTSYVVVLLDKSGSMGRIDKVTDQQIKLEMAKTIFGKDSPTKRELDEMENLSRLEMVKNAISNQKTLLKLQEKMKLKVFPFAGNLDTEIQEPKELQPSGNLTAIGNAMQEAVDRLKGQYISAFVIISDGRSNYGRDPKEVAKNTFSRRSIPVYTVIPGRYTEPKDVEISRLEAPERAFEMDPIRLKFNITGRGCGDGEKSEVSFTKIKLTPEIDRGKLKEDIDYVLKCEKEGKQDTKPVEVDLRKEGEEKEVEIPPIELEKDKESEDYAIIIRAPEKSGEVNIKNNYIVHFLKVSKERIKVLYAEGSPRHEYKFLKNALIRDKSIEVQTFLTNADPDFPNEVSLDPEVRKKVLPLLKFPGKVEDLIKYDVIILGDVNLHELARSSDVVDRDKLAKNIEQFVSTFRGGIVFVAGSRDNPRSFQQTDLVKMLPVVMEDGYFRLLGTATYQGEWRYKLTEEGKRSVITKIKPDPKDNENFWLGRGDWALPGLRWFLRSKGRQNDIKQINPAALTLVEAINPAGGDEQGEAVVLTRWYGGGMVVFVGTDESWVWRKRVGDYYYYKFWRQVIDWARGAKVLGMKRFEIFEFEKDKYGLNEDVNIEIRGYTEKYEPMKEPKLKITIDVPKAAGGVEKVEFLLELDKYKPGTYRGVFRTKVPGIHRVWLEHMDEKGQLQTIERKFEVVIENKEDENPIIDEETLESIAIESVGGRKDRKMTYRLEELSKLPDEIKPGGHVKVKRLEDDIWDSPFFWILFALFITTEWVIRKINRML